VYSFIFGLMEHRPYDIRDEGEYDDRVEAE